MQGIMAPGLFQAQSRTIMELGSALAGTSKMRLSPPSHSTPPPFFWMMV
jgi:hypothetical protein